MSPLDRPNAPASIAASTSRTIERSWTVVGRDGVRPQDRAADRPLPDEERDVRPEPTASTASRYSPNVRHRATRSFGPQRQLDELAPAIGDRCERVAAVAGQLGREALREVADQRAVDEERAIGVAVRVDEPGVDDQPVDVDDRPDLAVVDRPEVADGQDPVAEHPDVGRSPWRAGPIDEEPAAQDEVEGGHRPMMTFDGD